ncbi:MAG: hypothetical protein ACLUFL_04605 [Flavonifractor plautii]
MCVNDTVIHLANPHVPFGGVGNSGMGACHEKDRLRHLHPLPHGGAPGRTGPAHAVPYGAKT